MKRNSITIWIESENAITLIPWTGTEPDFTGVEEPTLSVLLAAWEAGKDSIEVIADPEPITSPVIPNWGYFGGAVIESQIYEKYKTNADFQVLASMIAVFTSNGGDAQMYPAFMLIWNKFIVSSGGLLEDEILEITQSIVTFNIPFNIDDQGVISL